jgi:outer membrane protein assembly factor BamB
MKKKSKSPRKQYMEKIIIRSFLFSFTLIFILSKFVNIYAQEITSDEMITSFLKLSPFQKGLCLNLNDEDGKTTIALAKGSSLTVQGISSDFEKSQKLRFIISNTEVADRTSFVWKRTSHLPYLDDLINLVVATNWEMNDNKQTSIAEIVRVLKLGGVAIIGSDTGTNLEGLVSEANKIYLSKAEKISRKGAWIKITKVQNPDFGEWSNLEGNAELNNVSPDKIFVAPYKEIRWCNGPIWATETFQNAVYAGGRSYHHESIWVSPTLSQWYLVARDANNGCELWREKIDTKKGYVDKSFCADDKLVFCIEGAPNQLNELVARDGNSGKIFRKYPISLGASVTSLNDCLITGGTIIEKESGKIRWKKPAICQSAGANDTVFVYDGKNVEAVKLSDGKTIWKIELEDFKLSNIYLRKIFSKADMIYIKIESVESSTTRKYILVALEKSTGKLIWSKEHEKGSILPFSNSIYLVNSMNIKNNPGTKYTEWDIQTGIEKRKLEPTNFTGGRCWGITATENFITSIEESHYFDRKNFSIVLNDKGIRSQCQVGQAFAYGLMYNLPHACNCGTVLRGVSAVSGGSKIPDGKVLPILIKGNENKNEEMALSNGWQIFRGNMERSSSIANELPSELKLGWSVKIGNSPLTQLTGVGEIGLTAETETHRVYALDLKSGKVIWSYTTEGRIPLPPTIYKGVCLIADQAGWVYCLNVKNGNMIWQFQAAPEQKYMCAFGQIESSWPVRSGVLVIDNIAYFSAGRTGVTDGGIHLYAVNIDSGQQVWKRIFTNLMPNDLLTAYLNKYLIQGRVIINPIDGKDLPFPAGLHENVLHSCGYETGTNVSIIDSLASTDAGQIWIRKSSPGNSRGAGNSVAFDKETTIFSVRGHPVRKGDDPWRCDVRAAGKFNWINKSIHQQMYSMILSNSHIFCAGVPEFGDLQEKPNLWILSLNDGKEIQKIPLEGVPTIEGLSSIDGKLFLTTQDGHVYCFEKKQR